LVTVYLQSQALIRSGFLHRNSVDWRHKVRGALRQCDRILLIAGWAFEIKWNFGNFSGVFNHSLNAKPLVATHAVVNLFHGDISRSASLAGFLSGRHSFSV
jgi:hypothetical protein